MLAPKIFCVVLGISFTANVYFVYISQTLRVSEDCKRNEHVQNIKKNYLSFESDKYVKHCITEKIVGIIPSNLQVEKFSLADGAVSETSGNRTQSFQKVFKNRAWGKDFEEKHGGLSASGPGSTLRYAQDVIGVLHKVFNDIKTLKGSDYKVKFLDVPCGDFAWMNRFLSTRDDIEYTGMDIVPEVIEHHSTKYKNKDWKFVNGDVVVMETLGDFDMILCRMMLQHLASSDIKRVLNLFSKKSSGLLLTTTFSEQKLNAELRINDPGRCRDVNLEIPPFSLSPPICLLKDAPPGVTPIYMGLWKLPLKRVNGCIDANQYKVNVFSSTFFSCTKFSET